MSDKGKVFYRAGATFHLTAGAFSKSDTPTKRSSFSGEEIQYYPTAKEALENFVREPWHIEQGEEAFAKWEEDMSKLAEKIDKEAENE